MKYVTSVSKIYKHRGFHIHRQSTKKYWHIIGHEYDEYEEKWSMFCEQVSGLKAWYYKHHKWKRIKLTCPDCRTTYYHYVRKINDKTIGKQECPDCYENFKDLYEEFLENLNS